MIFGGGFRKNADVNNDIQVAGHLEVGMKRVISMPVKQTRSIICLCLWKRKFASQLSLKPLRIPEKVQFSILGR